MSYVLYGSMKHQPCLTSYVICSIWWYKKYNIYQAQIFNQKDDCGLHIWKQANRPHTHTHTQNQHIPNHTANKRKKHGKHHQNQPILKPPKNVIATYSATMQSTQHVKRGKHQQQKTPGMLIFHKENICLTFSSWHEAWNILTVTLSQSYCRDSCSMDLLQALCLSEKN